MLLCMIHFALFAPVASLGLSYPPIRSRSSYAVKDKHHIPDGWRRAGLPNQGDLVEMQIGLKQSGIDRLEQNLHEVSDPKHSRYGQHLSATDVSELVQPTKDTTIQVEEWLLDNGIKNHKYSPGKDWISATLSIAQLEELLNTVYETFLHDDGMMITRAIEWSLPAHLHEHIDVIQPTNAFLHPSTLRRSRLSKRGLSEPPTHDELSELDLVRLGRPKIPEINEISSNPSVEEACYHMAVSSICLRAMYGTASYQPQASESQRIGLVNFLDQVNNRSDIDLWLNRFRPDAAEAGAAFSFKTEIVAGGSDQQTPNVTIGREGALDAETVLGIGFPIPLVTYNVGGEPPFTASQAKPKNTNEPYLAWLQHILAQENLPQVITISYADEEQTVPYAYAKRVCDGFAQLGARGVSVLVASGDDGVGESGKCVSNDGSGRKMFQPTFPASCPYVTAIGATRYTKPEMVAWDAKTNFSTGGGFSNYFSRPKFQDAVVPGYVRQLEDSNAFDGLYNKSGRGIPDVSAMGYHYLNTWNKHNHIMDGTSAATPTVASIIALVNDALLKKGLPVLGFLNPWLYSKGYEAFTDVTIGSTLGCDTAGFPAVEGWDAASGFGTPWFPKLKEMALERGVQEQWPWYYQI